MIKNITIGLLLTALLFATMALLESYDRLEVVMKERNEARYSFNMCKILLKGL